MQSLISDNSAYYFFSAVAQVLAGVAGLIATMAVFRFQGISSVIYEIAERAVKPVLDQKLTLDLPWTDADRERIKHSRTARSHAAILERYFTHDEKSLAEQVQAIAKRYSADKQEQEAKLRVLKETIRSFEMYRLLVRRQRSLRVRVISNTGAGFAMIGLGSAGTLLPDFRWIPGSGSFPIVYLALVIAYLVSTLGLVRLCFNDPSEIQ